ncbi:dihydrofolate reductase family protein [Chitinophaga sp. sic0106]|uniref:dihydrofolate reductase family protein n=1 Tax=Chitinophaga sp. sic0106 TaxID=2854785 RepID=UPI001C47EA5C|nr:RibD family protein [Chitinophaga sp. sic0106]MBV7530688.1 RibD family protein [Chitinophaga sp. sic0106]
MSKPKVICHMMSTIDGRIIMSGWGNDATRQAYSDIYNQCHNTFDSDAWLCGRVTMAEFDNAEEPLWAPVKEKIERVFFKGDASADSFAVAIDAHGKLGWSTNEIGGDHIIQVLTEKVSDGYLAYLQQRKVSYIFAGKDTVDLTAVLSQLQSVFGINSIMLEGGGTINGAFLHAGLIDEISLLLVPVADGRLHRATTFDVHQSFVTYVPQLLQLRSCEQLEQEVVWLRYGKR